MRWRRAVYTGVAGLALWAAAVHPHTPEFTFRAYLDRRFWQPLSKYEASLGRTRPPQRQTAGPAFAGMSALAANEAVRRAGEAYRNGSPVEMRTAVQQALQSNLSPREREEMLLLEAKIDLREADPTRGAVGEHMTLAPEDRAALRRVAERLQDFMQTAQSSAFRSEARGWLARVQYLTGDYPSATKIYLDELANPDTIFSRESLIASLRTLFPYNGSEARLTDHLEEYFDTPAHALFVVDLVTNPIYGDDGERAAMAEAAKKTIATLLKRADLFRQGSDSDALALALMRASLYMGDPVAALTYARRIPVRSETTRRPEYNWMVAACHFLMHDYAAAEAPLRIMYRSAKADPRDRVAAAQGLLGVYQKLARPVDQLHAAFLYYQAQGGRPGELAEDGGRTLPGAYLGFVYWPWDGLLMDLPYLLDVQLRDEDLVQYLDGFSRDADRIGLDNWARGVRGPAYQMRRRSAREVVEYALAVRYARQERYVEAAALYEKLHAHPRASRMRELVRLHAEATNPQVTPDALLEAQYAYAVFLETHSTQVFFNDMLWYRIQNWVFLSGDQSDATSRFPSYSEMQGLTREEREFFLAQERRVKDEQEERWRAYKILVGVVDKAGHTELGDRAAAKALRALRVIHTGRFGRDAEIKAADERLSQWRREHKRQQ